MRYKLFYRVTNREILASILTIAWLVLGIWLGIHFDPIWLSRFGAIIIVTGVIFAVTDLPTALEKRIKSVAKVTNALVFNSYIRQIEDDEKIILNEDQKEALRNKLLQINKIDDEHNASLPKKRFLIVEAAIICIGTLVNGFGECLICTITHL